MTFSVAAEAYDRYIGRYSAELAEAVSDAAAVEPGQDVIDVGCGPGGLTGVLAARLGPGHVTAVDPSAPFAAACAQRHPGVHVEQAPAEQLPFGDASFDRALSQLVVNFMSDAITGVAEMRRVVRPGGVVAAAVWDYAGGMTLLRQFWDAATALDPSAAEKDEGRCMRWCTPGELRELLEAAALHDIVVGDVVVTGSYASFDDLWAPLESGVGPAGTYVAGLGGTQRAALARELAQRLGAGEQPFSLPARAWIATGRV